MARYIDAEKLIEHLKDEIKACEPVFYGRANGKSVAYGTELGLKSAISFAEALATADVAPKSEVAREIFEEIGKILYKHTDAAIKSNSVPCKLIIDYIGEDIAELKKKYQSDDINA